MSILESYLKNIKVQKALNTKPGEEGFSLVELVVVIAVLAILSAVAIPAFTNVQANARAAAVQNGMVNGLKECAVREAENETDLTWDSVASFSDVNAFRGFVLSALNSSNRGTDTCYAVLATSNPAGQNSNFTVYLDANTGAAVKQCTITTKPGCKAGNLWK
tara:strand:- start:1106 stop:1591 length:486 start_codon:yes stop_codon:yes gene_type:complete